MIFIKLASLDNSQGILSLFHKPYEIKQSLITNYIHVAYIYE